MTSDSTKAREARPPLPHGGFRLRGASDQQAHRLQKPENTRTAQLGKIPLVASILSQSKAAVTHSPEARAKGASQL